MRLSDLSSNQLFWLDHDGKGDKAFAIAGYNDSDVSNDQHSVTWLNSPGFIGKDHHEECLNFWFDVKVFPSYFI